MKAVATDPVSSHFLKEGRYTRFADWRFIHRTSAKSNLVLLNAKNHPPHPMSFDDAEGANTQKKSSRMARRLQRHHDAIVKRIVATAKITGTQLKHNVIITRSQEAHIINVTVPLEGTEHFEQLRRRGGNTIH